jgi:hypothetical protein
VLHKGVKRMLNKAHEIVDEFNPIEKRRLAADEYRRHVRYHT